jgi:uncharacterized protein (DUF362 family)
VNPGENSLGTDLSNLTVAIASGEPEYPKRGPFNPPLQYPELPYATELDTGNKVYSLVRESLRLLGMDAAHFGSSSWNPLGEVVVPGDRVLIKPNFVLDRNYGTGPVEAVITHGAVLRAISDYVLIALKGKGEIIIGDAPQMNCRWGRLLQVNGIGVLSDHLGPVCANLSIPFTLIDFRQEETEFRFAVVWKRKRLVTAEDRTIRVTLGNKSLLEGVDSSRLYGADYDRRQIVRAHEGHRHEYRIARPALEATVVISVPKLKVHSKVGTTLNIKNMVGINTDKNHLAHYRIGSKSKGGDEFSDPAWDDLFDRWLSDTLLGTMWRAGKYPYAGWRAFRKVFRKLFTKKVPSFIFGNWHGNDTAWRMALDLNRILLTCDPAGEVHNSIQRKYFSFIDGVVGGQGDGPLKPDAYPSGVILAGSNPLAVDWVATRLMGLNPQKIPIYANAPSQMREWLPSFDINKIQINSNRAEWNNLLQNSNSIFRFTTAPGWRGQIESYVLQDGQKPSQELLESGAANMSARLS